MCCQLVKRELQSKTPTEVAIPDKNNAGPVDLAEQMNSEFPELDIPSDSFPSDPSQTEYTECIPVITEAFADDSFPMPNEISQEVKDCCALTAAYYDALTAKTNDFNLIVEWENKDQCCSALEWSDGSMACTPWGPPTPPSGRKMKRSIVVRQHIVVS